MPSLIPGYEYEILFSSLQKDNKGDRWVSEFVEAGKKLKAANPAASFVIPGRLERPTNRTGICHSIH